jgi:hypothetical protein
VGFDINWTTTDPKVLNHPLYLKYSATKFVELELQTVKGDIGLAIASKESAAIVAYLAWLVRVITLIQGP